MKNNNKLKIISAAVFLLTFNNSANAQWATIDAANVAQSTITAAKTTLSSFYNYYTMLASGANGQGIQQTTQAVNLMQKQSVLNLQTQDMMQRKALGDAEMARDAWRAVPTLEACAEASGNVDNSPKSTALRATTSGGGGGSQGAPGRAQMVVSTATAQAAVLKEQTTLGTCVKELAGAAGCGADEKVNAYAGADMHPRGIKGDVKGIARDEETGPAYNNYSLDDTAFKIAKKYASDMAYYDKPKVVPEAQLKKNPGYAAMYKSVETKLDAANDAILDIAKFKRASMTDISSTIPGKAWAGISNSEYVKVTGLKQKPGNKPSMYDLVNFDVKNDYFGNEKAKMDSIEEVNKRLALSNYIAWTQYQQQENTNTLLAHILVQLTTPANKALVDAEHVKTISAR
jgi:hypothetical protein